MNVDTTEVWCGIMLVYAWMHCLEFWCGMIWDRKCVLFPGVYISKTSYIRQGENSLEGFYRSWHHVEFYRWIDRGVWPIWLSVKLSSHSWVCDHRYLRFFPDGQVVMLTTTEDPQAIIPRLRTKKTRYSFSNFLDWFLELHFIEVNLLRFILCT